MRPPAGVHYLRPNHAEWTPPAVISLDTESVDTTTDGRTVMGLRCWAAYMVDRRRPDQARCHGGAGSGHTAASLAAWVDDVTRGRDTTYVFCHNLSFDLTTSRLPLQLVALGWSITDAAVGGASPWMRLANGRRRVTLTDSWSWLPYALEAVGQATGRAKPELPECGDPAERWLYRCRADALILLDAVCQLMDWWDAKRLGRWTITGAACGWNAYRHTPTQYRVTIDPDPELVAADRLANYGGRRGVWRVGDMRAGPYLEIDFTAAYPTVAANLPLPTKRERAYESMPVDAPEVTSDRWGLLGEATVRTDTPRYPLRANGAVWYPTGEFTTTLAGPDIRDAARRGELVALGPGWVHRLGYAMQPWALWLLAVQHGRDDTAPPAARLACKAWGRSVIGKWAGHSYERTKMGPAPTDGWSYEDGWDHSGNCAGGFLDLAGQRWWVAASGTPDNAYPAVLAWVEAEVRARLSRAIELVGTGTVVQADTDGMIVAQRTLGLRAGGGELVAPAELRGQARVAWVIAQLNAALHPLVARVKARHDHVQVLGPQHMVVGGKLRYAGIPGLDTTRDGDTFTMRPWPKLQWQLAHGDRGGYVRPTLTATVEGPYPSGWLLSDGTVVPVRAKNGENGPSLIPWYSSGITPGNGLELAPRQHPRLAAIRW